MSVHQASLSCGCNVDYSGQRCPLHTAVAVAETSRPAVVIDPAMCSGEPCILGRRIPVYLAAETVWWHGIEEGISSYDVSRADLLVACWYAAVLPVVVWGRDGVLKAQRNPWPARWRAWAQDAHKALWSSDYDAVPDPPSREVAA